MIDLCANWCNSTIIVNIDLLNVAFIIRYDVEYKEIKFTCKKEVTLRHSIVIWARFRRGVLKTFNLQNTELKLLN